MKETINIKEEDFLRVNNDINGNPRFVIHFLKLSNPNYLDIIQEYEYIIKLNKKLALGGRKYHNKQYGGGLVFQSYNLNHTSKFLNKKLNKYYQMEVQK